MHMQVCSANGGGASIPINHGEENGAGEEIRTLDIHLGKVTLYH